MFLPSVLDLTLVLATISVSVLTASFVISSSQGKFEILVSYRRLEAVGILLGGMFLAYVFVQFAIAVAIR